MSNKAEIQHPLQETGWQENSKGWPGISAEWIENTIDCLMSSDAKIKRIVTGIFLLNQWIRSILWSFHINLFQRRCCMEGMFNFGTSFEWVPLPPLPAIVGKSEVPYYKVPHLAQTMESFKHLTSHVPWGADRALWIQWTRYPWFRDSWKHHRAFQQQKKSQSSFSYSKCSHSKTKKWNMWTICLASLFLFYFVFQVAVVLRGMTREAKFHWF